MQGRPNEAHSGSNTGFLRLQRSFERLQIYINHFTILIDRTPKIVLLAPDLYKNFIYEESVASS
jgi:hypothetical protein